MPKAKKPKVMKDPITADNVVALQAKCGAKAVVVVTFEDDEVTAMGCGGVGGMADAVNGWTEKLIDSVEKGGLTFPTPDGLVSLPNMRGDRQAVADAKAEAAAPEDVTEEAPPVD